MSLPTKNMTKEIMKILVNKFGIGESCFTVNDAFYSIGMDSIALIELQYEVTKKLGLGQSDLKIYEDDSVGSLLNKINFLIKEKKHD
jgi:acyl carrier protein